jgi:hypothetical protein
MICNSLPPAALLVALATGSVFVCGGAGAEEPSTVAAGGAAVGRGSGNWHAREGIYFQKRWGIDIVGIRRVSSGFMLRLSYRIVDAEKAKPLLDKKVRPFVIDEVSGARLAVPAMENIGELRQTGTPEAGRTYFVIFGNPAQLVRSGGRVSIVIGDMRVDGFTVD